MQIFTFWRKSPCGFSNMSVSKNSGTPNHPFLIGFSIINHPFWGTLIFGNPNIIQLVDGFNPVENISQNGNLPLVGVKVKNIWNHHLVIQTSKVEKEQESFFHPLIGTWWVQCMNHNEPTRCPCFWPYFLQPNLLLSSKTFPKSSHLPCSHPQPWLKKKNRHNLCPPPHLCHG